MKPVLFLDSGPLGMVTHPRGDERTQACAAWFKASLAAGAEFVVPDICDYEVRRELLRAESRRGIWRLDQLRALLPVMEISSTVILRAAHLWASIRRLGLTTAADHSLDGDVILAAQATTWAETRNREVIIVTENVGHLGRLAKAVRWDALPATS